MSKLPRLLIVLGLTLLFSQSSRAHTLDTLVSRPAADGWTHYSDGFDIDLPTVLKTYSKHKNAGGWWVFGTLDSAIVMDFAQLKINAPQSIVAEVKVSPFRSQSDWDQEENLYSSIGGKNAIVKILQNGETQKSSLTQLGSKTEGLFMFHMTTKHGDKLSRLNITYSLPNQLVMDSILPRIAASFH